MTNINLKYVKCIYSGSFIEIFEEISWNIKKTSFHKQKLKKMFTNKFFYTLWFLSSIQSVVYSSEYLYFGGNAEEPKQFSTDNEVNARSAEGIMRTHRSIWKFLRPGLFRECSNCCNNCNYNVETGDNFNSRRLSPLPFQPWRPLWRPLEPLFGRSNYNNYETGCACENNSRSSYGNGTNNTPNYDISIPPDSKPEHDISGEVQSKGIDYQLINNNDELYKETQHLNGRLPKILYQPIIYVSPQYQGNKALNQIKQKEIKYGNEHTGEEKPDPPSSEIVSNDESEQNVFNSNSNEAKSIESSYSDHGSMGQGMPALETPYTQTNPYIGVATPSHPSANTSVSSVSTVYNIITPSIVHPASMITPNVHYSSDAPLQHFPHPTIDLHNPLVPPAAIEFLPPLAPIVSPIAQVPLLYQHNNPIHLTHDDQPYRVCPELFKEYQHKLNTYIYDVFGERPLNGQLPPY